MPFVPVEEVAPESQDGEKKVYDPSLSKLIKEGNLLGEHEFEVTNIRFVEPSQKLGEGYYFDLKGVSGPLAGVSTYICQYPEDAEALRKKETGEIFKSAREHKAEKQKLVQAWLGAVYGLNKGEAGAFAKDPKFQAIWNSTWTVREEGVKAPGAGSRIKVKVFARKSGFVDFDVYPVKGGTAPAASTPAPVATPALPPPPAAPAADDFLARAAAKGFKPYPGQEALYMVEYNAAGAPVRTISVADVRALVG